MLKPRRPAQVARLMEYHAEVIEEDSRRKAMPVVLSKEEMRLVAHALRRESWTGTVASIVLLCFVVGYALAVHNDVRDQTLTGVVLVAGLLALLRLAHRPGGW